jgi:hypothetical protein
MYKLLVLIFLFSFAAQACNRSPEERQQPGQEASGEARPAPTGRPGPPRPNCSTGEDCGIGYRCIGGECVKITG